MYIVYSWPPCQLRGQVRRNRVNYSILYVTCGPVPVQKITIEEFLSLGKSHPLFDVRSPGEFNHAHIPGAISLPLFNDEERKVVGTTYKQESREKAIKTGLDYFGLKMRPMIEVVENVFNPKDGKAKNTNGQSNVRTVLVHCWRGGMRSAGVAWLLDLYGFKVYTLAGGYKAYRKWVLLQFEKTYSFNVIGGYTGSGKTLVLHELKRIGKPVIDLEALANHKGSAFGAMGQLPQPKQEMFENLLASDLHALSMMKEPADNRIWIEDESQRIGNLNIPPNLWKQMRNSPLYFLNIPFEERLEYIVKDYGKFDREKLVNATLRIHKRLGGLETKNALNHLVENDIKECFRILLTYYDKWYSKGLHNRENLSSLLNKIECAGVDTVTNTQKAITCNTVNA